MTGVIADTHALIWYLLDSPRLSAPALAQFEMCQTAGSKVGVSSISIVEMYLLKVLVVKTSEVSQGESSDNPNRYRFAWGDVKRSLNFGSLDSPTGF